MDMTDRELIGYCEIHCETPRALFHSSHINRMLQLAKIDGSVEEGFYSMHEDMAELCKKAKENLNG